SHVPVGLGHQRLLLGDRRGRGSHHRNIVRIERGTDDRGHRLPDRNRGILRGAAASALRRSTRARDRDRRRRGMTGRRGLAALTTLLVGILLPVTAMPAPAPKRELAPLASSKTALVPFDVSPFPYRGEVPEKARPFLDVVDGERRGHYTERGGTYWEDQTYSDQRVLLHIPKGFDPRRPAVMVVFFHGNGATLTRDVRNRQAVPRQVTESGLNAVLVAPQFAVNALDSSAGRFWEPGVFTQFLDEAAERLTELYGDE